MLGGCVYDFVCFVVFFIMMGFDEGLVLYCGKILECVVIVVISGLGFDCVMGILDEIGFMLKIFN